MKILYINMNKGSAVELIGNIKIQILARFSGIDEIQVFRSQKEEDHKELLSMLNEVHITSQVPGVVIFEDEVVGNYVGLSHDKLRNLEVMKIAYVQCRPLDANKVFSTFDYVFKHYYMRDRYFIYLPLSPGNKFHNKYNKKREDRKLLYTTFPHEGRFKQQDLEELDKLGYKVDLYCYKRKGLEIPSFFDYKGALTRSELVEVYNEYKYMLVSNKECLSLPLREALMCGCLPVIFNRKNYYSRDRYFADEFIRYTGWTEDSLEVLDSRFNYLQDEHSQLEIHNRLSLERMILSMLLHFRGMLMCDIKWRGTPCEIIELTPYVEKERYMPLLDYAIDWDKISL